jgi:hypothetical protein
MAVRYWTHAPRSVESRSCTVSCRVHAQTDGYGSVSNDYQRSREIASFHTLKGARAATNRTTFLAAYMEAGLQFIVDARGGSALRITSERLDKICQRTDAKGLSTRGRGECILSWGGGKAHMPRPNLIFGWIEKAKVGLN